MMKTNTREEKIAMNIVYQIGDLLSEALPKNIAHKYFVDARQKTNDKAIDFVKTFIEKEKKEAFLKGQDYFIKKYKQAGMKLELEKEE